jgi:hypothetical protein
VILPLIMVLAALGGTFALASGLVRAGIRAGDRPGDATVTAGAQDTGQPDEPRPVIIATVRNPGRVPLVAGFSARRRLVPAWLEAGMTVSVPQRTGRRRFRPGSHAVVGVIEAGAAASFGVPVPVPARAGRYRLTAVIGQAGGRLRVFRVPVSFGSAAAVPPARAARAADQH